MTTKTRPRPTKERLIRSAAHLFRTHGYHGVGLNDLLNDAQAPKGSLYHHFPNGKSDLAIAASTWAADQLLIIIAASFEDAGTFKEGATTFCYKLAKFFDKTGWDGCPISATLFEGPDNIDFRKHAEHLFEGWISEVRDHGLRLGLSPEDAQASAETVFILIQGGWTLARARNDSNVLRNLPKAL